MAELKIGLQLYSVRDKMMENMEETLKKVKEIGYDYVEFAGYFDKSAEEIRALLDKYGLECISVHQGLEFYTQKGVEACEFIKKLGAKYSAIPWYELKNFNENWNETVELFSKTGKLLKDNGLEMLYHNHDFEFQKINGKCILDKIYSEVPSQYLNPEFDVCWIKYAGYDPCEYIKNYADRINVVHFKDFKCKQLASGPAYALIDENGNEIPKDHKQDNEFRFQPVGYGMQNMKEIIDATIAAGVEYAIVEQDNSNELYSLEAAKLSREFLKSLGY